MSEAQLPPPISPTLPIATRKTRSTPMLPTGNTSVGGVMTISAVPCLHLPRRFSVTWSTSLSASLSQPLTGV